MDQKTWLISLVLEFVSHCIKKRQVKIKEKGSNICYKQKYSITGPEKSFRKQEYIS